MHTRLIRPVAIAAALALTLSAGLVPATASAQQQVFGQWSTQNNQNQRRITGVVTYFSQYDLRIAVGNGNGNGRYGNGDDDGDNDGNGNGNGRKHRHHRDNDNGQNNDGQYGDGQNNNGQYGNGQYGNGNEQRVRLHQGTVINPRGTNLQNGMQLRITGHRNNDGTFEADRIDVGNNGQNGYNRNGDGYQHP